MTTDKEVRISIDWLRYTMPYQDGKDVITSLAAALPRNSKVQLTGELVANSRGYDRAMALSIGRVHWHTAREDQKISVEFTGSDCNQLHHLGFDWAALWRHISDSGGHITTIHFAIDVLGYGADHVELENALHAAEATTKARKVFTFAGGEIGDVRTEGTTYVGKPSSDRQMRVYNKAAEQGVEKDWTRIELVIKGKRAKALLVPLIALHWVTVARSTISAFVAWKTSPWWQAAIAGEVAPMPIVARVDTATVDWLLKQCLPTLRRELKVEKVRGTNLLAQAFGAVVLSHLGIDPPPTP